MNPELDSLTARVHSLEKQLTQLQTPGPTRGIARHSRRERSKTMILGLPLWEIAVGPDFARGERRGHAKAIFALGDVATGVFALGGISRGVFAVGGVACGLFALGGVSLGLGLAVGGAAVGGIAVGGAAIGGIAIGGAALGLIAVGGGAVGILHTVGPLGPFLNGR